MKSLFLFTATFTLTFMVSAQQCDLNAVQNCVSNFSAMVSVQYYNHSYIYI